MSIFFLILNDKLQNDNLSVKDFKKVFILFNSIND